MTRILRYFHIKAVFSVVVFALISAVPTQAIAAVLSLNRKVQIKKIAQEAFYSANASAKRQYQQAVRSEQGNLAQRGIIGKGGIGFEAHSRLSPSIC